MPKGIYLDNSTTTAPSDQTVSRMIRYHSEHFGSPASPHQLGQELFPAIEEGYRAIYKLIGAKDADSFVFTSSGAEAVNQAIFSAFFDVSKATGKNQIITSNIDEAPAIMSIGRLEKLGCVGKMAEADSKGKVTAAKVADALTPRTALVSLSWANGLTGVINPIAEIADLCKDRGVLLHVDATHVLGKLYYDLDDIGVDLISFNGDNLHGPKGTGGLYIKAGVKCSPFIVGGLEQAGHRAGTLNVPGLVGLGNAAMEALESRDLVCTEVARLRSHFENEILRQVPEARVFFPDQERIPNCTAIAFAGIANEAMLYALNRKGVYASIGGGNFQQIGLILMASGVEEAVAHSALSFSLSRTTTDDEIDRAIHAVVDSAKNLRKVSKALFKEGAS